MARMVVRGIRPWDGEYDLGLPRPFNAREWRWIRELTGYMPLTIEQGFKGADPPLFVVLAVIAMCRSGKIQREQGMSVAEFLSEADMTDAAILMVGDDVEDVDEVPLDLTSEPAEQSPSGSL